MECERINLLRDICTKHLINLKSELRLNDFNDSFIFEYYENGFQILSQHYPALVNKSHK